MTGRAARGWRRNPWAVAARGSPPSGDTPSPPRPPPGRAPPARRSSWGTWRGTPPRPSLFFLVEGLHGFPNFRTAAPELEFVAPGFQPPLSVVARDTPLVVDGAQGNDGSLVQPQPPSACSARFDIWSSSTALSSGTSTSLVTLKCLQILSTSAWPCGPLV